MICIHFSEANNIFRVETIVEVGGLFSREECLFSSLKISEISEIRVTIKAYFHTENTPFLAAQADFSEQLEKNV